MTKNVKLLPCPFCGAKAKTDEMEPMPPELAAERWNTIREAR